MSEIGFKNLNVLEKMLTVSWHPTLIALLKWLRVRHHTGQIVITSAFRWQDKGVHGAIPLRAFDLRSWVFKDPKAVCDDINMNWAYDPKRPEKKVATLHDVGKGIHFHIQVHPRTVYNRLPQKKESDG
jgi:hypothetical protein